MDEHHLPMGEGPIPDAQLEVEVRVVRHNLRNVMTSQQANISMLRDNVRRTAEAAKTADLALSAAQEARANIRQFNYDMFGRPERKDDDGILGRLDRTVQAQLHAIEEQFASQRQNAKAQKNQNQRTALAIWCVVISAMLNLTIFFIEHH